MSSDLAVKLCSGTQQAHTAVENVGFMKCFLKGVVDRGCFAKFLGNLYYVYSELEGNLIKAVDQVMFNSLTYTPNPGSTEIATAN